MCYESLVDGEYDEKPLSQLVREEVTGALRVGAVAALIVLGVLAMSTTPLWLVASASAGALVLGVLLQEAVLVAGVSVLRVRSNRTVRLPETTP